MDFESILIDIIACGVAILAWRCLPSGRLRWLFIASFLLLAAYKIYDPASDWRALLWARHMPVYVGEAVFYLFVTSFSKRFVEVEDISSVKSATTLRQTLVPLAPLFMLASGVSWYQIVTDQGLPHIFTLPIFVLVVSLVRLRLAVYNSRYKRVVSLFTLAVAAWIMIHVSEFIVESQKLIGGVDVYMPHIEFFWYCVGSAIFCYALASFKKVYDEQRA